MTMSHMKICFIVAAVTIAAGGCTTAGFDPYSANAGLWDATPYERGKVHLMAGRLGLASMEFHRVLAADGETVVTLNALAATYDLLGRYDLADRYYQRALSQDPQSVQTINNLGYSHLLRGEAGRALRYLAQAKELEEGNEQVQTNIKIAEAVVAAQGEAPAPGAPEVLAEVEQRTAAQTGRIRTTWLERTTGYVQTLVTRPDPELIVAAARAAIEPRLAAPAGRGAEDALAEQPLPPRMASPVRIQVVEGIPTVITQPAPAQVAARRDGASGGEAARPVPASARPATLVAYSASIELEGDDWSSLADADLEVSNGAGRRHMAARMRAHLAWGGIPVARLTNDASFSNMTTVIFYRDGFKQGADELARLLPIAVAVDPAEDMYSDIRLRLGGDLLDFDKELIPLYGDGSAFAAAT